ncbi:hypothetical protein HWV62_13912 [Athelia sp. TMB]|nr:hypothetical protein HWV62_13912 [Athelia sp. TMB]
MKSIFALTAAVALASQVAAHYTFPVLVANGKTGAQWDSVRVTNNWQDLLPLTDVTSPDLACYDTAMNGTATTTTVAAGSTIGLNVAGNPSTMYHDGVLNVYLAKAPSTGAAGWTPTGKVWFKVFQIRFGVVSSLLHDSHSQNSTDDCRQTNLATPSHFQSRFLPGIICYVQSILLFTLHRIMEEPSCAQITVTGGGSGTPGPLVAFPGEYTGYEPGILIDIYYPIPANYTQPGPAVWTG